MPAVVQRLKLAQQSASGAAVSQALPGSASQSWATVALLQQPTVLAQHSHTAGDAYRVLLNMCVLGEHMLHLSAYMCCLHCCSCCYVTACAGAGAGAGNGAGAGAGCQFETWLWDCALDCTAL